MSRIIYGMVKLFRAHPHLLSANLIPHLTPDVMLQHFASDALSCTEMAALTGGAALVPGNARLWTALYRYVYRSGKIFSFQLNGQTYVVDRSAVTVESGTPEPVCGVTPQGDLVCMQLGSSIAAYSWDAIWRSFPR